MTHPDHKAMSGGQELRSLDERRDEIAQKIASGIEARLKGGPNLKDAHLALIDGLADELPAEAIAEWKGKVADDWDRIDVEAPPLQPEAQPAREPPKPSQYWVNGRRLLKPPPQTQPKAKTDEEPQIDAALSVSDNARPTADLGELGKRVTLKKPELDPVASPPPVKQKPAVASVEAVVLKTEIALGSGLCVGVSDLTDLLVAMNGRHAVIGNVGGKCRIVEWVPSELDDGALVPVFQSKTDFVNRYANRPIGWNRKGEPLTAGQWWFDNPRRADYRGVVFKPAKPAVISHYGAGNWCNLWRGWGINPEKGRWPLLRQHIEEVLSGGDPKMTDYAIRWTAWGFQNPGDLAEAALVLRGKKGAGKGIFLGTVRKIYGPHGLQITHASHLTGNFNAHLWTCAYLFADEAFWAGDKQGESVLKGVLTERAMMITKKGVDSVMAVNCVKCGMSSNLDWVVPASHDERRYAVSDIDNRYAKGTAPEDVRKEYFGAIQRELAEGGAAAMLYDLMQMDLGDWHPREVPITSGLMRQKKESLRGNFQWVEPLLQSGMLPANANRPNRITTEALLAYVKTFRGLEFATDESIASFLYNEIGFIAKLSPEGNRFRGANGGARGWEFPPLLDLRERWETLFGGQWDWHNPEIDQWQKRARVF